MAEHTLFREFSEGDDPRAPLQQVGGVVVGSMCSVLVRAPAYVSA